jgi:hypothetical protein
MVDKSKTPGRNVVDFRDYRKAREVSPRELVAAALAVSARRCRHCGAALAEGEAEEECSSAFNETQHPSPLRFRATPER